MSDLYSQEELDKRVREVGSSVPADEIAAVQQAWPILLAEVAAHRDEDPRSEKARQIADRWHELTRRTMSGFQSDPKIAASIAENYRQNAYSHIEGTPTPEDFAFIKSVDDARSR